MLLMMSFASYAQKSSWSKITLEKANSAKEATYLTAEEKSIVYYINLVRMNPRLFESTYIRPYLERYGITDENASKWIRSLQSELKSTRPMNPLKPKKDLSLVAKKHATDMGLTGKSGHKSSSGKLYKDRMKGISKEYYEHFENCQYGLGDPLEIVVDLLIDDGVEGASHRKSILNASSQYIGSSMHPHIVYKHNCVIVIAGRLN